MKSRIKREESILAKIRRKNNSKCIYGELALAKTLPFLGLQQMGKTKQVEPLN